MIIDFSKCVLSDRDLQYAGRAGEKRGIIYLFFGRKPIDH